MNSNRLTFAIFGNTYQKKKSSSIKLILDHLNKRNADVAIDKDFYVYLKSEGYDDIPCATIIEGNDFKADFAISMGGDGTFLHAASRVGNKRIPIIGVNMGRLGFLADIGQEQVEEALDNVFTGNYEVEKRSVLCAQTDDTRLQHFPYALNEIAILKHDSSSMLAIHAHIDGMYLTTYQADGLIISTPTGSTGYALSVGGPILTPSSHSITMSAVAPHSLNIRPIVLSDESEIMLEVESRSRNYLLAIDGRSESLCDTVRLRLRKADYPILVVKQKGHNFYGTLREKLMWGADTRQ